MKRVFVSSLSERNKFQSSKAIVLLSAGLDSAVNLYLAKRDFDEVKAITFNYGQRAAIREIERAEKLCAKLDVNHYVVELPFFNYFTTTALVNRAKDVPTEQVNIENLEVSHMTAQSVWVPNRNGIFLNIAAGFAEGLGCKYIVPGFNKEEALTFPDNTDAFAKALDKSFSYSTSNRIEVQCYTQKMDKTEIFSMAKKLNISLDDLWPCYFANESWCGKCESCQRFERAKKNN